MLFNSLSKITGLLFTIRLPFCSLVQVVHVGITMVLQHVKDDLIFSVLELLSAVLASDVVVSRVVLQIDAVFVLLPAVVAFPEAQPER